MAQLEKLAYISVIALCIVAIGILLDKRFNPPAALTTDPEASLVGKELSVPGLNWRDGDSNILIFISDQCPFCNKSVPFFQELSRLRGQGSGGIKLFAASNESAARTKAYLDTNDIAVDGIAQTPHGIDGVAATPTLVFVSSSGTVQSAFIGLLDSDRQKMVISRISR